MKKISKLKRVLIMLAIIVLALTTVCIVASASPSTESVSTIKLYAIDHTHIYGNWVIEPGEGATCSREGIKTRYCTVPGCDVYYTKTIAITKDAHVYGDWIETKPATCTSVGSKKATCTECGKETVQLIPMEPHTLAEMFDDDNNFNSADWSVSKAPVHGKGLVTQTGTARTNCKICGTTITQSFYYPDNWHIEDPSEKISIIRDTTCSLAGVGMRHCTVCGDTLTVTIPIDPDAHLFAGLPYVSKAPTCQSEGEGVNKCTECNEVVDVIIDKDPDAHVDSNGNILEWKTTRNPVVHIDGKQEVECAECGHQEKTIIADHNLTDADYTIRANPTCVKPGLKIAYCSNCRRNIEKDIPINDAHSWDKGEVLEEATCVREGKIVKHCNRHYGHVEYTSIPKVEHTFVDAWKTTVTVTCTTVGTQQNDCVVCKTIVLRDIPADPDAHNFETEWQSVPGKEPTCTQTGEEFNYCVNCKKTIYRDVPKHKNTLRKIGTTPATCTKEGQILYECHNCSAKVTEVIPIDENAHTYLGEPAVVEAPTCNAEGLGLTVCSSCKYECYVVLEKDPTNHADLSGNPVKWQIVYDASGCENGLKVINCPGCNKNETETIYSTHGMSMDAFNIQTYPTCEGGGMYKSKQVCTKCKKYVYVPIGKGHSGQLLSVIRKPDCTHDGLERYRCSRGNHFYYVIVPATGHTASSEYTIIKNATCTEKGLKQLYCSTCGEAFEDTIEIEESHVLSSWIIDEGNKATCAKSGTRFRVCLECENYREETKYNLPHEEGDWMAPAGYDCEVGGTLTRFCTQCHKSLGTTVVSKGVHGSVKQVAISSCTEHCSSVTNVCNLCGSVVKKVDGLWITPSKSEIGTCAACEKTYLISDLKPHSNVIIDGEKGYAETCTEEGMTNGTLCLVCGNIIHQQVIKPTGHNFQFNENGNSVCVNCGVYKVNNKDNPDIGDTCKCFCHDKGTIAKILFQFCNFFWKFLGVYEKCECGTVHWVK